MDLCRVRKEHPSDSVTSIWPERHKHLTRAEWECHKHLIRASQASDPSESVTSIFLSHDLALREWEWLSENRNSDWLRMTFPCELERVCHKNVANVKQKWTSLAMDMSYMYRSNELCLLKINWLTKDLPFPLDMHRSKITEVSKEECHKDNPSFFFCCLNIYRDMYAQK